jgi:hypothetical protein
MPLREAECSGRCAEDDPADSVGYLIPEGDRGMPQSPGQGNTLNRISNL